ncbi:MAG: outer membrane lipoprotein carrier protein LolA [Rhodospirillales bacterium]|nr:outer membrane lipoprotein carrier protein LolA [Rhodospirillales bacterium]
MRLTVIRTAIAVAGLICLVVAVPAVSLHAAATSRGAGLGAEDRHQIERLERYLNGLGTLQSRFLQVSSNGGVAEGDFYLWRPGRLRIDYDPPVPVLIIANNGLLVYFDRELEQVSHVPINSTPAGILTRNNLSFDDPELTITGFEHDDRMLRITIVQSEDPLEGSVTLVFSDDPIRLLKWSVVDAQGVTTEVTLLDTRFDVPLNPELFVFRNPRFYRDDF